LALTSEWVDSDLFAHFQGVLNVALLDALNAQIAENHFHVVGVDLQRADAFFASFAAD
jgi:hypothetical protein